MVEGKVTKLASFGAFVELEGGLTDLSISLNFQKSGSTVSRCRPGYDMVRRGKNISVEDRRIGLSMKEDSDDGAIAERKLPAAASKSVDANRWDLERFWMQPSRRPRAAGQEEEPAAEQPAEQPAAEPSASEVVEHLG